MLPMIVIYDISFFFFNDTATTEIYTLSLHDALPIASSSRDRLRRSECAAASSRLSTTVTKIASPVMSTVATLTQAPRNVGSNPTPTGRELAPGNTYDAA